MSRRLFSSLLILLTACQTGRGLDGDGDGEGTVDDPDGRDALATVDVEAGEAQVVDEASVVTLAGEVSNAGDQTAVRWSQDQGPTVELELPGALTTTFTAPAVAEDTLLVFRLEGLDQGAIVAADDVGILVRSGNLAPIVDAGDDVETTEEVPVVLQGSATDADGSIEAIEWVQLAGPVVALSGSDPLQPRFDGPAVAEETTLVFRLDVTDEDGAVGSDEVVVEITPVNAKPVVDAGADQTVSEGTQVRLLGSATDTDGAIASTLWVQTYGPSVALSDATVLEPTFEAPASGLDQRFSFRLEALDDEGALAVDTVSIVVETNNLPPSVDAGQDGEATQGDTVTLSGSATDDVAVASTTWVQIAGPSVVIDDTGSLETSFEAPGSVRPATVGFRLDAVDEVGAVGSDRVYFTITPLNTLPSVDAGSDQQVDEGVLVTLDGAADDPDGTVAAVAWEQASGPAVQISDVSILAPSFTAPAVTDITTLVFVLRATDDGGATHSDAMSVRVAPLNLRPQANAGPNQTVTEGVQVTLAGQATDSDGSVASVQWTEVTGQGIVLSDAQALQPTFTAPAATFPLRLTFELEVTDNEGGTDTDRVDVVVEPDVVVNVPPTVYAGPNRTVGSSSAVGLSGTASDSDGFVDQLAWTQVAGVEVAITDGDTLQPTFTAPDVECAVVLTFELAATDDQGAEVTDRVSVVVEGSVSQSLVSSPAHFDLEDDVGGIVSADDAWSWGVPTSGPAAGWDGTRVLATNLDGNAARDVKAVACLSPIDLTDVVDPVLTFRAFVRLNHGDGFIVEGLDPEAGWVALTDATPQPTRIAQDRPSFNDTGSTQTWWLHGIRLPAWLGDTGRLRFVHRTDGTWDAVGTYLDEIRVAPDASDPDDDGIMGILDEWLTHGTDPYVADDDGDGFEDGAEIDGGTDPLNPADFPGRAVVQPGFLLDFEDDAGALVTDDATTWEHGEVASGPGRAHSGTRVWATRLSSNYANYQRSALYLPPVDLSDAVDPTLAARLWMAGNHGDGMSVEAWDPDTASWKAIDATFGAYDATDAIGEAAWRYQTYRDQYVPIALSLQELVGDTVFLRFMFRSDGSWLAAGAFLDDVALYEESDDPDGDGLPGVLAELLGGTDPFVGDSDGDGVTDGQEVEDGTDPVDPASSSSAISLAPGVTLTFEDDDGGLAATRDDWQHGVFASGPGRGYSGSQGWATNLAGNYAVGVREYLYLPEIDLSAGGDPTLSFRLWATGHHGDGVAVEVLTDGGIWATVTPDVLAYDSVDAMGRPAWRYQTFRGGYRFAAVSLAEWSGERVRLRLSFRSDGSWQASGFYVDDLSLHLESDDPDQDGLAGVLDELETWGTDPYLPDSDFDGFTDGEEVAQGTDPMNGAIHPDAQMLAPGDLLDFEQDAGGLVPDGSLFEHGNPGTGPGVAWSGTSVWATGLGQNYPLNTQDRLLLPPIDLTGAVEPTLSFRLWIQGHHGDGLGFDVMEEDGSWTRVPVDAFEPYDAVDAAGVSAFRYTQGPRGTYALVTVDLSAWVGRVIATRFILRTDGSWTAAGAFLDDLRIDEESTDPDGDGLVGIALERDLWGTDPFVADVDLDGEEDGAEISDGTDPLNPVDHVGAPLLTPGTMLDFELDGGGLMADGPLFEVGNPASGPGVAWSGTRLWATNLSGNYGGNATDWLWVPLADLTTATSPTLSFRLWMDGHNGDGFGVEAQLEDGSWTRVSAGAPTAYESVDASGVPAFRELRGVDDPFVLVTFDLSAFVGRQLPLRLIFRSDGSWVSTGAYIDALRMDEESADPDGDGLIGIEAERQAWGTDPYLSDSDFDGFDDDVEIDAGSDPMDPDSVPAP